MEIFSARDTTTVRLTINRIFSIGQTTFGAAKYFGLSVRYETNLVSATPIPVDDGVNLVGSAFAEQSRKKPGRLPRRPKARSQPNGTTVNGTG